MIYAKLNYMPTPSMPPPKPPTKPANTNLHEIKVDHTRRLISGYLSVFTPDDGGDWIHKGAYARTLKERFTDAIAKYGAPDIRFLWQHDHQQILGTFLELKEDDFGLWFLARVSDTRLGRDTLTLVTDKAVNRNSIGYSTNAQRGSDGLRHMTKNPGEDIDLFEGSIVTFPMHDSAYCELVKQDRKSKGISNMEIKSHTVRFVNEEIIWDGPAELNQNAQEDSAKEEVKSEEVKMPNQVKKGAKLSQAMATAIVKPLTQIVQVLSDAGHSINWESGELENHTHDSRNLEPETSDPDEDGIAAEAQAEERGSRANPNPGTPDQPGVENGRYSPTIIDNPMGARIKSVHGVVSTLSCAKCGTALKCGSCDKDLMAYRPGQTGKDPAGQKSKNGKKDVTGVRATFKCATCGSDVKCMKCEDMSGMETMSDSDALLYKSFLVDEKDNEIEEFKNELNQIKMFLKSQK